MQGLLRPHIFHFPIVWIARREMHFGYDLRTVKTTLTMERPRSGRSSGKLCMGGHPEPEWVALSLTGTSENQERNRAQPVESREPSVEPANKWQLERPRVVA